MAKLIDPDAREEWIDENDPTFRIEYRGVSIPIMSGDPFVIAEKYLEKGITKVWNPELLPTPKDGWGKSPILPSNVKTEVFLAIDGLSKLTESEEQD